MNGPGMQAFLEAFNRTSAMLDENERRNSDQRMQEDQMARQTQMQTAALERQGRMDATAAEDRARQIELQKIGLMPQMAEMASTGETPEDAKHMIETILPGLMKSFGQDVMAYGQPAVEMAGRTITARQKRQMADFVKGAVDTDFIQSNPDSDPVVSNLPAHVSKMLGGKTEAKLSELQSFAEMPVGKPAGKTRIPAAAGSFEDFSTATPERKAQILADRKAYMQSDDRPRVDVNVNGGLNPNQSALLTERLAKNWQDVTAPSREMNRQFGLMETGLKRFRAGDKNGGSQAVLVTFQKILDPTSVVRESEYARSADGVSMLARLQGYADRLAAGGAGVPEAELEQMVQTARQMKDQTKTYAASMRSRIEAVAAKNKIDPVTVFGIEPPEASESSPAVEPPITPAASHGPALRERRKAPDGSLVEWDGKGWKIVR